MKGKGGTAKMNDNTLATGTDDQVWKTLLRVVWVMLLLTLIGPGIVMKGR